MKKILLGLLFIFLFYNGFAQVIGEKTKERITTGFDIFTDIWINDTEGVKMGTVNPGFTFFAVYNWPIKEDKLRFAAGLDISLHNMYTNSLILGDTLTGKTNLIPFNDRFPDSEYQRIKFNLVYVDIPLELRFRSEKKFRWSVGVKVGYLIRSQWKYVGEDFLFETSKELKVKFNNLSNIDNIRYGIYARCGWHWINFYGYYSISNVFEKDKGPELYPISVGVSLYPFK